MPGLDLFSGFLSLEARITSIRQEAHRVFSPSSPVSQSDLLFGRDEQLRQIERAQRTPGTCVVLFGPAAAGKTSLVRIVEQREPGAVFYCSAGRGHTFALIVRSMLDKLHVPAVPDEVQETSASAKEAQVGLAGTGGQLSHRSEVTRVSRNPYVLATPDQVAEELKAHDGLAIVDAFEKVKRAERLAFSELIKTLSDRRARLRLMLVGDAGKVDELVVNYQEVRRHISVIEVPPLSRRDLESIVDRGFAALAPLVLAPVARGLILARSAGQAHAVHQYCLDCVYALEQRIQNGERKSLTIDKEEFELALRPEVG